MQQYLTRHEQFELGRGCQKLRQERRRGQHVLEVIQNQQTVALAQMRLELIEDRLVAGWLDIDRPCDSHSNVGCISQIGQRNKPDAVAKITPQIAVYL
jgi:hypothetical protein